MSESELVAQDIAIWLRSLGRSFCPPHPEVVFSDPKATRGWASFSIGGMHVRTHRVAMVAVVVVSPTPFGVRNRLIGEGMSPELADARLAAWEA